MNRSIGSAFWIGTAALALAIAYWLLSSDRSPSGGRSAEVTLSWSAPTQYQDGERLTGLAGYYIYYGTLDNQVQRSIHIQDPATTEYTISDLETGTYFFTITAVTTDGYESDWSAVIEREVR